jgi:DNA (cytosine-5)-methyltransferase 1
MTFDVTPQLPDSGLTVAELFAGGGLMAVGLRAAGYNLVWANDFDKNAVKAYRHNLGDHVVHGDITTIDPADIPDTDVIAGGPPCQDYSVAGTGAGENGERGKLVWAYLRIIEAKRPKAFIFENVKGLITKKHRPTFNALLAKFEEIGYRVSWRLINAWDYGVAQKRERVFIVGIREDLGFTYEFPEPSPEDYRTKVLRDVIGDLPEPFTEGAPPNQGKIPVSAYREYNFDSANDGAGWDEPSWTIRAGTITGQPWHPSRYEVSNHNPQPLSEKALEYLQRDPRHLQKHRPPTVDEPSPTLPAVLHKGVPYGLFYPNHGPGSFWTPKSEYTYDQANRVQSMDAPCNTIPAHHNSGQPIHPTQAPRRFTVRECLRIQSVPDWYVLPDDISLSAQYRIVGNGVASRVAYLLGIALAEQLRAATESSVIGERLIPGTPDGRGTANSRKEAV